MENVEHRAKANVKLPVTNKNHLKWKLKGVVRILR